MIPQTFVLDGQTVTITAHAQQRILEMDLAGEDVRAAITCPDDSVPSRKYPGSHNRRYADFTLGCRMDGDHLIVITAVWATDEAWRKDLDGRANGDRVYRKFATPKGLQ